jgi:hypothetical protein
MECKFVRVIVNSLQLIHQHIIKSAHQLVKIKLEKIQPDARSSFRILVNPRLNNRFFWHFHPEYELIFINGGG